MKVFNLCGYRVAMTAAFAIMIGFGSLLSSCRSAKLVDRSSDSRVLLVDSCADSGSTVVAVEMAESAGCAAISIDSIILTSHEVSPDSVASCVGKHPILNTAFLYGINVRSNFAKASAKVDSADNRNSKLIGLAQKSDMGKTDQIIAPKSNPWPTAVVLITIIALLIWSSKFLNKQ